MPSVGQLITIVVKDRDPVDHDDIVDELTLPFDDLLNGELPAVGWWSLYGPNKRVEDLETNTGIVEAALTGQLRARSEARKHKGRQRFRSEWRGRLLLQLAIRKRDSGTEGGGGGGAGGAGGGLFGSLKPSKAKGGLPEKLLKRRMPERIEEPPKVGYVLQAAVVLGADLSGLTTEGLLVEKARRLRKSVREGLEMDQLLDRREEVFVEVEVEGHRYRTEDVKLVDGRADFVAPLEAVRVGDRRPGALAASSASMSVQGSLGRSGGASSSSSAADGDAGGGGVAAAATQPGVLRKVNTTALLRLPEDSRQLGDVIVYLCAKKDAKRLAFVRLPATTVLDPPADFAPSWQTLQPTVPSEEQPRQPLPSLLLHCALRRDSPPAATSVAAAGQGHAGSRPASPSTQATPAAPPQPPPPPPPPRAADVPWPPPAMPTRLNYSPYEVRLYVFQGRAMPPSDNDGLVDAYVVADFCGQRLAGERRRRQSSIAYDTVNPQWYETMRAQVWLPELSYAPPMSVEVWDHDLGPDPDDLVGTCRLHVQSGGDGGASAAAAAAAHRAEERRGAAETPAERQRREAVEKVQAAARGRAVRSRLVIGGDSSEAPSSVTRRRPLSRVDPQWHQLHPRTYSASSPKAATDALAMGRILLQLDVRPLPTQRLNPSSLRRGSFPTLAPSTAPLPDLRPTCLPTTVHVAVLGLQNLSAGGPPPPRPRLLRALHALQGPQKPFVEVDVGGRRWADSSIDSSDKGDLCRGATTPSCAPSAHNPLFMQVLRLEVSMPTNPVFLPEMQVAIKDSLFGGLRTPLLGTASIDLAGVLPEDINDLIVGGDSGRGGAGDGRVATALAAADAAVQKAVVARWGSRAKQGSNRSPAVVDAERQLVMERAAAKLQGQVRGRETREHLAPRRNARAVIAELRQAAHAAAGGGGGGGGGRGGADSTLKRRRAPPLPSGGPPSHPKQQQQQQATAQIAPVKEPSAVVVDGELVTNQEELGALGLQQASEQMAAVLDEQGEAELQLELDNLDGEITRELRRHATLKRKLGTLGASARRSGQCGCCGIVGGCCSREDAKALARSTKLKSKLVLSEQSLRSLFVQQDALSAALGTISQEPTYMNGRSQLDGNLELDDAPFDSYAITSGQGEKTVQVATLDTLVRVTARGAPLPSPEQRLFSKLTAPKEYVVRVYVLRGANLPPKDTSSATRAKRLLDGITGLGSTNAGLLAPKPGVESYPDPFLKVRLGSTAVGSREEHLVNEIDPPFYRRYDLVTTVPGETRLQVECWDYDWCALYARGSTRTLSHTMRRPSAPVLHLRHSSHRWRCVSPAGTATSSWAAPRSRSWTARGRLRGSGTTASGPRSRDDPSTAASPTTRKAVWRCGLIF